jgi:hypothetical protein
VEQFSANKAEQNIKYSENQFYVRIQIVPVKEGSKSGWFQDPSRDEGRKMRARRPIDECR